MKKTLFQLALTCGMAAAQAAFAAGSNIALNEYPGPNCSRPAHPVQPSFPQPGTDATAATVDAYNQKVKAFNQQIAGYNAALGVFNGCMHDYIDNGNADMQRIKDRLDRAIADANAGQ